MDASKDAGLQTRKNEQERKKIAPSRALHIAFTLPRCRELFSFRIVVWFLDGGRDARRIYPDDVSSPFARS